jgi:hypothetical protein
MFSPIQSRATHLRYPLASSSSASCCCIVMRVDERYNSLSFMGGGKFGNAYSKMMSYTHVYIMLHAYLITRCITLVYSVKLCLNAVDIEQAIDVEPN